MHRRLTALLTGGLALLALVTSAPSAHAQCWSNSLWQGLSGFPSPTNGGYPAVDLRASTLVAPDTLRIDNALATSGVGSGFSTPTQQIEPPLLVIEGETRLVSGTNSVGLPTIAQVSIRTTAFPILQLSFEHGRIALMRGQLIVGEAFVDTTLFHSWRVEIEVATDTARFWLDGQLRGAMSNIASPGASQLTITWGNIITVFSPDAISEWRRFSFNAAYSSPISTYCVAKLNSTGCTPRIGWTGFPNLSAVGPFEITLTEVPPVTYGILAYSIDQAAAVPFSGGYRCIGGTRIYRTPISFASAQAQGVCDVGLMRYRFSDEYQTNAFLVIGTPVYAQWFYRDPNAGGWGLSDGLQFTVCP